ncbi:MAG: TonB-dependent receptor [Verrucomicrobia bacterium]|nr:TonB-dependent receptor [Verrucomicrobiota bacterium]
MFYSRWMRYSILFSCLILFLFSEYAVAGTTGKISGRVVDASSGDPLPGANIQLVGTSVGASSDVNGDYFILNVHPGTYLVKISFIGYSTVTVSEVIVIVDKTTTVSVNLEQSAVEGQEITIVSVRPTIERDLTSSKSVVDASVIQRLSVTSLQDVVASLPGVVLHNGEVHLRGGRAGEELHLIDGASIRDPLFNTALVPINPNAIEQLEIITGTFNAEYGQALSGVFNTILKEGGDKWDVSVTYRSSLGSLSHFEGEGEFDGQDIYDETLSSTDNIVLSPFPGSDNDGGLGYFDKNHSLVEGTLGGPLTDRIKFFLSARYEDNPTSFPALGTKLLNVQPKLTFRVSDNAKLAVQGMWFDREGPFDPSFDSNKVNGSNGRHNYWLWKYNLDAFPQTDEKGYQAGLNWNHTLSPSTFYNLRVSLFSKDRTDASVDADGNIMTLNDPAFNQPNHNQNLTTIGASQIGYFDTNNAYGIFNDNKQKSYTVEGNITSQVTSTHQLKSGVQVTSYSIDRVGRDTWFGRAVDVDAIQLQKVDVSPMEGAVYAQDRMEFGDLILNVGGRLDFFNVNADDGIFDEQIDPNTGEISRFPNPFTGERKDTKTFVRLSPRLGFSHPIGDNRAFHYAYGTFFQRPRFYDLLENYLAQNDGGTESGFFIYMGNPNLKPQITTTYEMGMQQGIGDDWRVDITGFYKDISNLVSNKEVFNNTATDTATGQEFSHYFFKSSDHFGNIRGGEVSIEKRYSNYWSGRLGYTFNVAKGTASGPVSEGAGIFREGQGSVTDDRFFLTTLDFARKHVVNGYLDLRSSWREDSKIAQFGANFLFNMQSGLPVTSRVGLAQATLGEESPWNTRIDAKFDVTFDLGTVKPNVFIFVQNLLNRRNVLSVKDPASFFRSGDNFFENAAGPRNDLTAYDIPFTIHFGFTVAY